MEKKTPLQVPSVTSPLQKGTIRSRNQLQTVGGATEKQPPAEGPGLPECSSVGVRPEKQTGKTQYCGWMLTVASNEETYTLI